MFNLTNYEKEIRAGAAKNSITNEEALKQFIYNLIVMKPYYDIFGDVLNFRAMGQQWNSLSSDIRNNQREHMKIILGKTPRTRSLSE